MRPPPNQNGYVRPLAPGALTLQIQVVRLLILVAEWGRCGATSPHLTGPTGPRILLYMPLMDASGQSVQCQR